MKQRRPAESVLVILILLLIGFGCTPDRQALTAGMDRDFDELEALIPHMDRKTDEVSAASVGWHIDHTARTINVMFNELNGSDPEQYRSEFNFLRTVILTIGFIPRGAGTAPDTYQAAAPLTENTIRLQLAAARQNISSLYDLPEQAHYDHPAFGVINRDQAVQVLAIHTNHHLKIVQDILEASGPN